MTDAARARGLQILLAEDDADLRSLLAITLRRDGYRVREVSDGTQLISELARLSPDVGRRGDDLLLITDLKLPFTDSLDVLRGLSLRRGLPNFILITAFGSDQVRQEAVALGALAVFDKPFDFDDLRGAVREMVTQPRPA